MCLTNPAQLNLLTFSSDSRVTTPPPQNSFFRVDVFLHHFRLTTIFFVVAINFHLTDCFTAQKVDWFRSLKFEDCFVIEKTIFRFVNLYGVRYCQIFFDYKKFRNIIILLVQNYRNDLGILFNIVVSEQIQTRRWRGGGWLGLHANLSLQPRGDVIKINDSY